MFKWLRRRREAARRAAENANRLRKRSDQAEATDCNLFEHFLFGPSQAG